MDTKALYSLSYGLYLLSVRSEGKDSGCIINTAVQVGSSPTRIAVSVLRENYTCSLLEKEGVFNLSVLTEEADFSLFSHFGMQSGRTVDKFAGFSDVSRSENGLLYLTKATAAFLSVRVDATQDLGSHMLFIGTVTDGQVLSAAPPATYSFYHAHIKPAAASAGWRCRICGYVHTGDTLPPGYTCPICHHGPEDFEKTVAQPPKKDQYVCSVCGYVHTGDAPPEKCPLCGVPADKFTKQ